MVDFNVGINQLVLDLPITNAAGVWCTTKEELEDLGKSMAGAIIFKTMTKKPRQGNPKPRFFAEKGYSVNSMGLPNLGVDYYCQIAPSLKKYHKPLIASIAGFTEDEFAELFDKVDHSSFDGAEINLSCPNLAGKGIFAYDQNISFRILKKIMKKRKGIVGVKLPPYNSRSEIEMMAKKLVDLGVDYITLINGYPLGCMIDYQKEAMRIRPNMGIGGLGGEVVKPISLAQVALFNYFSQGKLGIIGAGGVSKGSDVYEYILAGASAVAVATALHQEGPAIFSRLKKELNDILVEKGVKKMSEKIGRLKFL